MISILTDNYPKMPRLLSLPALRATHCMSPHALYRHLTPTRPLTPSAVFLTHRLFTCSALLPFPHLIGNICSVPQHWRQEAHVQQKVLTLGQLLTLALPQKRLSIFLLISCPRNYLLLWSLPHSCFPPQECFLPFSLRSNPASFSDDKALFS